MTVQRNFYLSAATILVAGYLAWMPARAQAQTAVPIKKHDIGGVVTSPHGPEAGVWVIAETHDLPTRFARMVVTDDQGRYVVPDLPQAHYKVWVRGYGLIDSPKIDAEPGKRLDLTAVLAPNDAAAAQYYPAIYWYSMLKIPGADQFGGKSDIPEKAKLSDWLNAMKNNGCVGCHQLGDLSTRTLPKSLGEFKSSEAAWARRVQSGQSGPTMVNIIAGQFNSTPIQYFADWTDRIAEGELPHAKPQRPQGVERNIVVTTWDYADDKHYTHDEISTDKRHPTVNAYGRLRLAGIFHRQRPDPRSGEEHRHHVPRPGARQGHALLARPGLCGRSQGAGAVALLGERADLGHPHQQPQFDVRREGPAVVGGGRARQARIRIFAGKTRACRPPSCSRSSRASVSWRCSIRRP